MNRTAALLAAATLLASLSVSAQSTPAGSYVTEGGWGRLDIRNDGGFVLEATGANGHSCNLEGRIARGRAALDDGCTVRFDRKAGAIEVAPEPATDTNRQACRAFCGARAHFAGSYFAEQSACRDDAVRAERAAFLADYQGKRFPQAAARFEKMLGACGRFLWWMTEAEVRNDLALAQHRAGRTAACAATLEPLKKLFDPAVGFPPVEKEWADGVLPRIRFNMKLCGLAAPAARP